MTSKQDPDPEKLHSESLGEARCSAFWVRSGKTNGITWDEYEIREGENGLPLDRDDPRFFEHHPEGYDNA